MKNFYAALFIFSLSLFLFIASAQSCLTGADKPPCDGNVSITELMGHINEWYRCSACVPDLFQAIEAYYGIIHTEIPVCGNGLKEGGEECDDNNTIDGDGCSAACRTETECDPDCSGKECGDDGCGGSCGDCGSGFYCTSGICKEGNVYYVSQLDSNCSDNGNGTSEEPWCNLSRAQNYKAGYVPVGYDPMVAPGDTVIVKNGSYGTFDEDDGKNPRLKWYITTRTDWITYKAATGHMPVLNNIIIRNEDAWNTPKVHGSNYLIFDGFQIDDGVFVYYANYIKILNCSVQTKDENISGYYAPYYKLNGDYAVYTIIANYITIENCDISHCYKALQISTGHEITIKNNTLHLIASDGISLGASVVTIENNYIYDVDCRRAPVGLVGTVSGSFAVGDALTQASSGATGIYASAGSGRINAYITSQQEFEGHNTPHTNLAGPITGPTGTLTQAGGSDVDPSHTDGIEIMSYNAAHSEHDITIRGNRVIGLIPRPYIQNGVGFKLDSDEPSSLTNVLIENNLIVNDGHFLVSANGPVYLYNNTFYTNYWRLLKTSYSGNAIITRMYNNIFGGNSLIDADSGGYYTRVVSHGNNIFGNDPDTTGKPNYSYPFDINSSSEFINVNVTKIFINAANNDFRPRMDSVACNGSVNHPGVAVGALPCV